MVQVHLKQVILRQIVWATILPQGLFLELGLFVELRQIEVLLEEGEITLAKERIREKKMMTTCGQRKHWKKTATLVRSSLKPLVQKDYPLDVKEPIDYFLELWQHNCINCITVLLERQKGCLWNIILALL